MANDNILTTIASTSPSPNNKSVGEKISEIDNYIKNNNDLTAYVYFKVNDFELNTSSDNTKEHYVTYLENQKTGVGQGNKFKLKIVFHQDFSHNGLNVLQFEKALSYIKSEDRNVCILKYGYLTGPVSSTYQGFLLSYDVTANKQLIEYTLEGVTGEETSSLATVNWYPPLEGMDEKTNTASLNLKESSVDAAFDSSDTAAIAEYNELVKKFNKIYTAPIKINPFEALCRFVYDYNEYLEYVKKQKGLKSITVFNVVDETGFTGGTSSHPILLDKLQNVTISLCRNQTATEYIEYLISLFQVKSNKSDYAMQLWLQDHEVVDRFVFEYRLSADKSSNEKKVIDIVIKRLVSEDDDSAYTFSNYTSTNRLLLDFSLKYDGTVALTVDAEYEDEATESNAKIYIGSDGRILKKATLTKNMFVAGSLDEVTTKESNRWIDLISCSNNCTMRTVGIPYEIPVGAVFKINSYIGEVLHHQSGRCYVVGAVDKIQNNMFTTDFTMIRLPGAHSGIDNLDYNY